MTDLPEEWARIAREEPMRWARYVADIDQAYAAAQVALDRWIDVLADDIRDRPEKRKFDDAQPMMALTVTVLNQMLEQGPSFQMLAVYNTAVYRLARQRLSAAAS